MLHLRTCWSLFGSCFLKLFFSIVFKNTKNINFVFFDLFPELVFYVSLFFKTRKITKLVRIFLVLIIFHNIFFFKNYNQTVSSFFAFHLKVVISLKS